MYVHFGLIFLAKRKERDRYLSILAQLTTSANQVILIKNYKNKSVLKKVPIYTVQKGVT